MSNLPDRFSAWRRVVDWLPSIPGGILAGVMERLLPALAILVFGLFSVRPVFSQASLPGSDREYFPGIDLLYPQFGHPQRDVAAAIKHHDFRFLTLDRIGQDVPGLERYPNFKALYGLKLLKEHLHLFASASEKFSFDLRKRGYAEQYNQTLRDYVLAHPRK